MSVLDQITSEDNKIDSSEVLASKVDIDLIKENEFNYKYWMFVFFDYKYLYSPNTEEYLKDCFETCPYIRNFCLDYIFDEPEHSYPEYCGKIPGPHIKVMFNMTRENVYSIVRFLSVLLKYIENDKDYENRYTITRQINIVNWRTETHNELIRAHFWKFNVLRNYSFDKKDDNLQKLFAPFDINPGEYNDVLEKISLYDKNRYTLWKMRNKETKILEIVVNYEYCLNTKELTGIHSEIIPYVISGKNYSDLIIKMCYLECVGQEQLCTYDFDYTVRYEGLKYSTAFPLPRLGFDAYDNIRTIGERQRYEYPDHYSDAYRLIIRLARLRENYSVDDCMLRMVLQNVVGRIAKRSKYKNEPERLFFDLFSKVDKLDTQSIIQETLKQTEIINKRRQQKKEIA